MSLETLFEWLATQGVDLDAEQRERFEEFQIHLYEANSVMNLTRVPIEECGLRHFADSLLFHDKFEHGCVVLDIGTGPGFPAWPLAGARPDLNVTAIDSNGKMIGFLSAHLLPNLRVVRTRAEEWGVRNKFDFVTGRAVAPLGLQLELSSAPCKVNGKIVPMRTPSDELKPFDLSILGLRLSEVETRRLPGTEIERLMPTYVKTHPTDSKFPRKWADMKSKSLS